jgi:hypothetical protein
MIVVYGYLIMSFVIHWVMTYCEAFNRSRTPLHRSTAEAGRG